MGDAVIRVSDELIFRAARITEHGASALQGAGAFDITTFNLPSLTILRS